MDEVLFARPCGSALGHPALLPRPGRAFADHQLSGQKRQGRRRQGLAPTISAKSLSAAALASVAPSLHTEVPDFMWNAITRDGHVYGAPINAQSEVWLRYNKAVFEKAGVAEPQSYDELFASLDKIKAAGVIPFAVGGQDWQLNILFLKILAGVARDVYLGLQGADHEAAVNSEGFRKAAEIFVRLRAYDDEGSPGRQWNVAVNMVAKGQAAMMVMGDWAKGEFTAAGQTAGVKYGCMLGPEGDSILLISC